MIYVKYVYRERESDCSAISDSLLLNGDGDDDDELIIHRGLISFLFKDILTTILADEDASIALDILIAIRREELHTKQNKMDKQCMKGKQRKRRPREAGRWFRWEISTVSAPIITI